MNSVESLFRGDPLRSFDVDLQDFYRDVLEREIGVLNKRNVTDMKQALKEVVDAYKRDSVNNNIIFFDSAAKRCAYVLKHCPCFTSAVAVHLLETIKHAPSLFQRSMFEDDFHLCCLGGGPGTDIVAVCKIVSVVKKSLSSESHQPFHFRITIIDLNQDWKMTAGIVLRRIVKTDEFFANKKVSVHFDYLEADLTEPFSVKVKRALQQADLVTMVYFLSAVNKGLVRPESIAMVQKIMKLMKKGSLLFFLDSAAEVNYRVMDTANSNAGYMDLVYGPLFEEFHCLSLDSIKTFLKLYAKHFHKYVCLTNCFVSVAVWSKPAKPLQACPLKYFSLDSYMFENPLSSQKRISDLTTKMLDFKEQVRKLISAQLGLKDLWFESETPWEEKNELEDSVEYLAFYDRYVPKSFFQTKEKRRHIFTEYHVSV